MARPGPAALPVETQAWALPALLAVCVPTLLAINLMPSATFVNQAAALVGWGGWLAVLAQALPQGPWRVPPAGAVALLAALALVAVSAAASPAWTGLPWTLALSAIGMLAAAVLVVVVAVRLAQAGLARPAFQAFCIALLAAGLLGTLIGIVQVFAHGATGGRWIAESTTIGRAVGNLRQPNHLSSLLLWAMIAGVWLGEAGVLRRGLREAAFLLMLFGVVLTASRTGMVGIGLLALWGLLDRRLSRPVRWVLWLAPLAYLLLWLALTTFAPASFGGNAQFHKTDVSSSRFGIWANTLALIAAHPWIGVGFGELNFAWSLTPFPGRPTAFFDHTHNLPLQFAVELGLPLAALVLALLGFALVEALRRARLAGEDAAPPARAACAMVLMIGVHSLLEYPLWYSYFLLPAAFAFGLSVAGPAPAHAPAFARQGRVGLAAAALLLMLGGVASVFDYWRVMVIFAPPDDAAPLAQRIAAGQHSIFFGHHADYAAATTAEHPSTEMAALARASHYLLDTRLMTAWAQAYAELGDLERARHLAQRLREFRNPQSDEFFAPCENPPEAGRPFQCQPPQQLYDYRSFR